MVPWPILVLMHLSPQDITPDPELLGAQRQRGGARGVIDLVIEHQPDRALPESRMGSTTRGRILSARKTRHQTWDASLLPGKGTRGVDRPPPRRLDGRPYVRLHSPSTRRLRPSGLFSFRTSGNSLSAKPWNAIGLRKRLMAAVPTEVVFAAVVAGYGPP